MNTSSQINEREVFMGLFAFIKEAGEKLFGSGEANAAATADLAAANAKAAQAIHNYIVALKLAPPDLGTPQPERSSAARVAARRAPSRCPSARSR